MLCCPKTAGELSGEEISAIHRETCPEGELWYAAADWPEDRVLTLRERLAWLHYAKRIQEVSRWDAYPTENTQWTPPFPRDPILWALCKRRAGLARRLLEEKGALSWAEGSLYAPWTFRWSLSLLRLILDLSPRVGELACTQRFTCTGGGGKVLVVGNLLVGAAALDDLGAVELLLERGYTVGFADEMEKGVLWKMAEAEIEPFQSVGKTISYDCGPVAWYAFITRKRFALVPDKGSHLECLGLTINANDAMAAACLCGNTRIVLRLLRYPPARDSLDFHKALSLMAGGKSRRIRACLRAIEGALGMRAEEFVAPCEVENRKTSFFQACLRRHDFHWGFGAADVSDDAVEWMVCRSDEEYWTWKALPDVPRERLRQVLARVISLILAPEWPDNSPVVLLTHSGDTEDHVLSVIRTFWRGEPLMEAIPLDRNQVPPKTNLRRLFKFWEYLQIVGRPPKDGVSPLAQALLRGMCDDAELARLRKSGRPGQLLDNPAALAAVREENPARAAEFILSLEAPERDKLFLLALLGISDAASYLL